jgi:hypothetical protein
MHPEGPTSYRARVECKTAVRATIIRITAPARRGCGGDHRWLPPGHKEQDERGRNKRVYNPHRVVQPNPGLARLPGGYFDENHSGCSRF